MCVERLITRIRLGLRGFVEKRVMVLASMWLIPLLVSMGRFVPWSLRSNHRWIFQVLLTAWMGRKTFRFTGRCSLVLPVKSGILGIFVFRMWPNVMAKVIAWMELVRLPTPTLEQVASILEIAMWVNTVIKDKENVCSRWVSASHVWMKLSARMDRCVGLIQELAIKCALKSSLFKTA